MMQEGLGKQMIIAAVLGAIGLIGNHALEEDIYFGVLMRGTIIFLAVHLIRHVMAAAKSVGGGASGQRDAILSDPAPRTLGRLGVGIAALGPLLWCIALSLGPQPSAARDWMFSGGAALILLGGGLLGAGQIKE